MTTIKEWRARNGYPQNERILSSNEIDHMIQEQEQNSTKHLVTKYMKLDKKAQRIQQTDIINNLIREVADLKEVVHALEEIIMQRLGVTIRTEESS